MSVVLYEKKGRVAYITINRPEAMNAYNLDVNFGLEESLQDFDHDPVVWIAIVTGAGDKAFCAGADLKAIAAAGSGTALYRTKEGRTIHSLQTDLVLSKPTIAAINGYCLAGGFDIALACDIRIASENAVFGFPMLKRSLTPGSGLAYLVHQMPLGMAMELAYTGDTINAQEAYRIGLVNKVVPLSQLMSEAEKLAERICECGPLAVKATKESFQRVLNMPLDQGRYASGYLFDLNAQSEDAKEGPRAFAEKRKPVYKGR